MVAVVLVNWNAWLDCVECLDALLACDYPAMRVFLVDNDSSDSSIEHIAQWCDAPRPRSGAVMHPGVPHLTAEGGRRVRHEVIDWARCQDAAPPESDCEVVLVRAGANLGFAGGNNVGMRCAGLDRFDYFWLLNTDTVVDRRALHELVACAQADARIGMVGSTLRYYQAPETIQALGGGRFDRRHGSFSHIGHGLHIDELDRHAGAAAEEMAYVVGASMLVSARFVREVGLMQEDYFLYYEEVDWACRGATAFRLGYAPHSFVYHKVGMSSAKAVSWFAVRHLYRNRIRFVARFAPDRLPATRRHLAFEAVRRAIKGQVRRALLIAGILWNSGRLAAEAQARPRPMPLRHG